MANPDNSDCFHVLIIGAGPAGLLAAQALQKQGIRCTVFEQADSIVARARDWNFGIYWAQVPLSDCLPDELSNRVNGECQVDSRTPAGDDYMPIYNSQSGELLKAVPTPYSIRLHRRNFLRLISTGIDIRFGKRLAGVTSDGKLATAFFEDGTSESGNLLIGTEGAHSKVREFLVGKDEAPVVKLPLVATATMAKLPAEAAILAQKLHPRCMVTFHPHGYFTWIGVHDAWEGTAPGDWTFMIIQSWIPKSQPYDPTKLTGPAILQDMKARANSYGEPFKTIMHSIPEDTRCWHNELSYWLPRPWDNRNSTVTILGDAAHPMTFHRGQGLNNAIHDVASLARQSKENGVKPPSDGSPSAVSAYEHEMWQRGKEAVLASTENSLSTHDWNTLLQSPLFTAGLAKNVTVQKAD